MFSTLYFAKNLGGWGQKRFAKKWLIWSMKSLHKSHSLPCELLHRVDYYRVVRGVKSITTNYFERWHIVYIVSNFFCAKSNSWLFRYYSRVLLLCQIWIVNYYIKCLPDNLSNENKNTGVFREMIFQKRFNKSCSVLKHLF